MVCEVGVPVTSIYRYTWFLSHPHFVECIFKTLFVFRWTNVSHMFLSLLYATNSISGNNLRIRSNLCSILWCFCRIAFISGRCLEKDNANQTSDGELVHNVFCNRPFLSTWSIFLSYCSPCMSRYYRFSKGTYMYYKIQVY